MLTVHNMYSSHNWEKFPQRLQTYLSEKRKVISAIFIEILKAKSNFLYFAEKYQFHSLNISEVIDSEKCSYFNGIKQLFQNTPRQWTYSPLPNTAQICIAALLS